MKAKRYWWVRIHRSCVESDSDAQKLFDIQCRTNANYNTETTRSMWFDFRSKLNAIKFVDQVTRALPYLRVTMGN